MKPNPEIGRNVQTTSNNAGLSTIDQAVEQIAVKCTLLPDTSNPFSAGASPEVFASITDAINEAITQYAARNGGRQGVLVEIFYEKQRLYHEIIPVGDQQDHASAPSRGVF